MSSLRWRRHRRLLALIAVALLALVVVLGDLRIAAITSSERIASQAEAVQNIEGTVDLFDDGVVHEVTISFDPAEYDYLIQTYQDEDEKAFIQASVTIDGTTIDPVGLRLKGNSTLGGLREDGPFGGGRGGREGGGPPSECIPAEGVPATPQGNGTPVAGATPTVEQSATPPAEETERFGGFGGNISADDPSSLPWLISFDEYVDGQRYQGYSDIAVRPVMTNETSLNEALALNLVAAAGEPSQEASYASVVLDDREAVLRLIVGIPGDQFAADNFAHDGVLYKALATGSFAYLGDDPTLYETSFDQETARNHQDLKPLIDLLKWVSEASDEAFAAQLEQHVEVESLARYIALQELLDNFDDMAGPGKNYYLWYNLETRTFTVLTWDLNLALAEFGGPGGRGPGGGGAGAEEAIDFDAMISCIERVRGEEGGGAGGRGGMRMGHPLKESFLAAPKFQELYAREYAAVYEAMFGDGLATAELERLAKVVRSSGLIEESTIETEVAALQERLVTQAALGPKPQLAALPAATPAATPSS